jgi:hypothetical protein
MRVLMQLIVDGLAYTGTVAAAVDRGVVAGASRAYAATIIASEPLAVDGREAYAATIDVANVAQLQLDPDARSERLRIVLVRTDFRVPLDPRDFQLGLAPGLLMLGYANLPGEFDRWSDHFDDLVRRLVFDTPEASAGAELMACESPDGITAFAFLRLGVTRAPLVIVRAEDQEDRECIERALATSRLEESRSYGFRPASLRFSVPPPTPVPDGPSALADAPAPQ